MSERYRPPNGTEGMCFIERWCSECKRDEAFQRDPDNNDGCPILAATLAYDVTDPKYPKEWIYGTDGYPTCTAFEPIYTERGERVQERCPLTKDMFEDAA